MGQRERRRRVRGEEADALVREQLVPLERGEVPGAIKVAAAAAALIAIANLVLLAAGVDLRGEGAGPAAAQPAGAPGNVDPAAFAGGRAESSATTRPATSPAGVIAFSGLMLIAAIFMLRRSYWAVLGFQALLALTCIVAFLSLMVASNLYAAALCLGLLLGAGTLFWFLIRAMARIQMPERPNRLNGHG